MMKLFIFVSLIIVFLPLTSGSETPIQPKVGGDQSVIEITTGLGVVKTLNYTNVSTNNILLDRLIKYRQSKSKVSQFVIKTKKIYIWLFRYI